MQKFIVVGILCLFVVTTPVQAQKADKLRRLQKQLEQQRHALKIQKQKTEKHLKKIEQLMQQLERLQKKTRESPAQPTAAQQPTQANKSQPVPPEPVGKAPSDEVTQDVTKAAPVMKQPGILTPKGHFVITPSVRYSYATNSRVDLVGFTVIPAITIGLINVREVNRMTVVGAVTARYGLTHRLELIAKVPYVYRNDVSVMRPLTEAATNELVFNANGAGLGDIEVAIRYQFNDGGAGSPYYIGSLRTIIPTGTGPFEVRYAEASSKKANTLRMVELPTGSGFYGIQSGLTVIFPTDPAVFFGGVSYLWTLSRNVDENIGNAHIGYVDPGDVIGINFGLGVALNLRTSFSIGYQHSYIGETQYGGSDTPGGTSTQAAKLLIGFAYQVNDTTGINLSVGVGLTRYTSDVSVSLSVPMAF